MTSTTVTASNQAFDGRSGPGPVGERHSIFPSVRSIPSLGRALANWVDLSLLLSRVPKTREDAEISYARDLGAPLSCVDANIVEVLYDTKAARDGSWAAFEIRESQLCSLDLSTTSR